MELEKQVVSLELAKKLKELGFEQESYFWWQLHNDKEYHLRDSESATGDEATFSLHKEWCSAYTVAELGEMLPDRLDEKAQATDYETHYFFEITKDVKKWEVSYRGSGDSGCKIFVGDENLSNAMAKVLIYLKDNNLIK